MLNAAAYRVVGRFSGQRSLQQIWEALTAEDPASAPTQADILDLLARLGGASLIDMGAAIDTRQNDRNDARNRLSRRLGNLNPLSWRLTIADPSAWLTRWAPRLRWLFGPAALAACGLLAMVGAVLATLHFPELRAHFTQHWTSPGFLLLMWFAYPVLKLLHELSHALAVHVYGGEVRELGITFMALVPVPFVDASAASGFHSRARRIAVSAAGILVEMTCAALALILWNNIEPGVVRDLALVVAVLGGVSTVAINANPLLRFDGYYVLCDALNLHNLASRSSEHWAVAAKRWLLRVEGAEFPATSRRQAAWYWCYAPLSFTCQLWITGVILLWVAKLSPYLALTCGVIAYGLLLGRPLWRCARYLIHSSDLDGRRRHAWHVTAGAAAMAVIGIAVIPMPYATVAQGVVTIPERASIRASESGFLQAARVADGDPVYQGEELLTLENLDLVAQLAGAEARLANSQASHWMSLQVNAAQATRFAAEARRDQQDIDLLRHRVEGLHLTAGTDGYFSMPRQQDRIGSFIFRGELLGYLLTDNPVTLIRVAIPQERATLIRERMRAVAVRPVQYGTQPMTAQLSAEVPQLGHSLPSAALGTQGGGSHAIDSSDETGLRTLSPVVTYEIVVPSWPRGRLGERAWVRIDHGPAPLATQWLLAMRQLFLRHVSDVPIAAGAS
jgi:putative peptide zinc metalloprotease protein